ncbi:MAG: DUF523 domain-containing protein [Pseudomonadota bacterium]
MFPPVDTTLPAVLREDPQLLAWRQAGVRPRVGVSACLLGERVRYDGEHRRIALVADALRDLVELVPLCPEVAIGLGVPRPAIQRVLLDDGSEVVRGVVDRTQDVTTALRGYAQQVARTVILHGYVFKARSPSCAPGNTPLFDEGDAIVGAAWGAYAEALRQAFPALPVCDEETLARDFSGFVAACYRRAAAAAK